MTILMKCWKKTEKKNSEMEEDKVQLIEQTVSMVSEIDVDLLYVKTRIREIVDARCLLWFMLYKILGWKKLHIAKKYNFNHSTIIYSIRKIETFIKNDKMIRDMYYRAMEIYNGLLES